MLHILKSLTTDLHLLQQKRVPENQTNQFEPINQSKLQREPAKTTSLPAFSTLTTSPKLPIKLRSQTVARAKWHEVLLLQDIRSPALKKNSCWMGLVASHSSWWEKNYAKVPRFLVVKIVPPPDVDGFSHSIRQWKFGMDFFWGCFSFLSVFPPPKKNMLNKPVPNGPQILLVHQIATEHPQPWSHPSKPKEAQHGPVHHKRWDDERDAFLKLKKKTMSWNKVLFFLSSENDSIRKTTPHFDVGEK